MSAIILTFTNKAYGLLRVCRVWKINRSGVYRHLNAAKDGRPRQRPGPHGEMPDTPMTEAIEKVIKDSPFHGEGYRKVHARLRY